MSHHSSSFPPLRFSSPLLSKSCQHYGKPIHLKQGSDAFPYTAEASKAPEGSNGEGRVGVGEEGSEGGDGARTNQQSA